ncbi:MAG: hypothetical protein KF696_16090 [Planctomycetes bacterium]|nr:hypothetical protein [Planctomycetota bacterium]MCW8137255.1 hypothetical protein [Planctomycetota bacterium]
MHWMRMIVAAAVVGLVVPFAVAQDAKKDERKTESKPADGKGDAKKDAKAADRGDAKAEALLKRAYTRVHSAEADGLKKLKANASIEIDISAFGAGKQAFDGSLWWKSGSPAMWQANDDGGGENPMLAMIVPIAKQVFEPYLGYVTGFEAWDVRFKEAKFKLLEAKKEEGAKEEKAADKVEVVEVTYGDGRVETFKVAKNMVQSFTKDTVIGMAEQEQKAKITFTFEYEDLGKKLRPKKVTGDTEIEMPEIPGENDPKNPGAPRAGGGRDTLSGSITVEKWGKAGDHDIALELKGAVGLKSLGAEFPAAFKITEPKINDDVKDADFPKGATPEGKTPSGDDEF